jgi:prophage regulatory protein
MFNNAPGGTNMVTTILRLPAVLRERGRSRSSHYLDIQQGLYTQPVIIGLRSVGWPLNEVATLNAARIAGKSDDEIRALVTKLETARKTAA